MNNPYQLKGFTGKASKGTLLGTFNTHKQALDVVSTYKADPKNVYSEFHIAKVFQWEITFLKENGERDVLGYYQSTIQAKRAYEALKQQYSTVEMVFIGGIGDA